ncbi:MAG TPA: response regulator [Phycisphaerae bacterium]|nr:response regulator [Phycisphaerae bacterium]HOJ74224.1 response regulator [Phycisphaerae bacterium]HOM51303.1 response regulator [Phycisphaerae bacterium]HON67392.1 response regulator [Phycisphaerae bacterium]HOQ86166.1 response regulator [Phycisphaerae bacterium]
MATIVLAEDDVHIMRVVSMWLKQHDHQVFEAPNGKRALELVRSGVCDVLVTDVNMPLMDGIELVKTCAAERLPRLGVVMLTSRCDQADIVDSLQGLRVVFHPKPFSPSRLVKEVDELIKRATTSTPEPCAAR